MNKKSVSAIGQILILNIRISPEFLFVHQQVQISVKDWL